MIRFVPLVLTVLVLGACGDDSVDDARESVEDAAGTVGARAAAEAMRVVLQAEDLDEDETLRDLDVLREAADDVPGDPQLAQLDDADADGKDDDGKVEVRVGDQTACLSVEDNGNVGVEGGACDPGDPS